MCPEKGVHINQIWEQTRDKSKKPTAEGLKCDLYHNKCLDWLMKSCEKTPLFKIFTKKY